MSALVADTALIWAESVWALVAGKALISLESVSALFVRKSPSLVVVSARSLFSWIESTADFAPESASLLVDTSVARFSATALATARASCVRSSVSFFGQGSALPSESVSGLATARPISSGYISFGRSSMRQ